MRFAYCALRACHDNWLVKPGVLRCEDTDLTQSGLLCQVNELLRSHRAVAAFEMMGDPASRSIAGHVQMDAIPALIGPIPDLEHNSPPPSIAVEARRHARGL